MRLNLNSAARIFAPLIFLLSFGAKVSLGQAETALQPGAKIPNFELKDQSGKPQIFSSLKGPSGLLLIFSRSADWCPLCKSQLIDFESSRKNFGAKGIRVASVTYDSPEVL